LVGIVAPSLKTTLTFTRICPFRWPLRGPFVPVVQEAQFSKRFVCDSDLPSISDGSCHFVSACPNLLAGHTGHESIKQ
jgi:hypothetical protein